MIRATLFSAASDKDEGLCRRTGGPRRRSSPGAELCARRYPRNVLWVMSHVKLGGQADLRCSGTRSQWRRQGHRPVG